MASIRNMSVALPTKRTLSQVLPSVVRVGDGMGVDGLSY